MYRNDLIRAAIVNKDLNKSSFAKESGIALNTVLKLWDGDENIELPSLQKACEFLEIPLHKVFEPKEEMAIAM
jgi:DNA-binding Xre family transcriptional regulator